MNTYLIVKSWLILKNHLINRPFKTSNETASQWNATHMSKNIKIYLKI